MMLLHESGLNGHSSEREADRRAVAAFAFDLSLVGSGYCSFAGVEGHSLLDREHAGGAPALAPSVQVVMVLAVLAIAALYHIGRHVASSIERVMLKTSLRKQVFDNTPANRDCRSRQVGARERLGSFKMFTHQTHLADHVHTDVT